MKDKNFIFGIRAVIEAITSGKSIDKVLLRRGLDNELAKELFDILRHRSVPYQLVPKQKIDRISRKNHQGVIAFVSPIDFYNIDEIVTQLYEQGKTPNILVLDGITDVRNFGAICRTAECAGVDAILVPEKGSAQINADAVKTSAGALYKIPVCRTANLRNTLKGLQMNGLQIFAASEKASDFYYDADYKVPAAIVMGAEDTGISKEILTFADHLIKIPILGEIKSLNVSVAAGILMYELAKQRQL